MGGDSSVARALDWVKLVIEKLLTPSSFPNWQFAVVFLVKTVHVYFQLGSSTQAVYPSWWLSLTKDLQIGGCSTLVRLDLCRVLGSYAIYALTKLACKNPIKSTLRISHAANYLNLKKSLVRIVIFKNVNYGTS